MRRDQGIDEALHPLSFILVDLVGAAQQARTGGIHKVVDFPCRAVLASQALFHSLLILLISSHHRITTVGEDEEEEELVCIRVYLHLAPVPFSPIRLCTCIVHTSI